MISNPESFYENLKMEHSNIKYYTRKTFWLTSKDSIRKMKRMINIQKWEID
jgi:hypothetical protein